MKKIVYKRLTLSFFFNFKISLDYFKTDASKEYVINFN